jgi:tripartite-type tricarboxylate transporter receptor subunit TctC
MTIHRMALLGAAALAALTTGLATPVSAQTYPSGQPVRIVVPFSAGSATDILARIVADKLSEKWSHAVVVENRPASPEPPRSPRARRMATR